MQVCICTRTYKSFSNCNMLNQRVLLVSRWIWQDRMCLTVKYWNHKLYSETYSLNIQNLRGEATNARIGRYDESNQKIGNCMGERESLNLYDNNYVTSWQIWIGLGDLIVESPEDERMGLENEIIRIYNDTKTTSQKHEPRTIKKNNKNRTTTNLHILEMGNCRERESSNVYHNNKQITDIKWGSINLLITKTL